MATRIALSHKTLMARGNDGSRGLLKLLEEQMQDDYYVEKQLVKALERMARIAKNEDLKAGFEVHRQETEEQIRRLEEAFTHLGRTARTKKCPGIEGILKESAAMMRHFAHDPGLDAGLVAAAQKVEHYEIAAYGRDRKSTRLNSSH